MSAQLAQLQRIQDYARERRSDASLYAHQRDSSQTFCDVLCYLLGLGAISDDALDNALRLARASDERTRTARSKVGAK